MSERPRGALLPAGLKPQHSVMFLLNNLYIKCTSNKACIEFMLILLKSYIWTFPSVHILLHTIAQGLSETCVIPLTVYSHVVC